MEWTKSSRTVHELCTIVEGVISHVIWINNSAPTSYGLLELIKEMEGAGTSKVSQW